MIESLRTTEDRPRVRHPAHVELHGHGIYTNGDGAILSQPGSHIWKVCIAINLQGHVRDGSMGNQHQILLKWPHMSVSSIWPAFTKMDQQGTSNVLVHNILLSTHLASETCKTQLHVNEVPVCNL